jgi:pyruvate dehydrogenase E2 component (dihydrolipoamide acetyltransferase)
MAMEVILPKVDMDMSSAVISRWHVKDGDHVSKGQPIFDIETDKSAMEIEAPGEGTIRLVDLAGARDIAIGTIVAMIYGAYDEIKKQAASTKVRAPPRLTATPVAASAIAAHPSPGPDAKDGGIRATPLARRLSRLEGIDLKHVAGTGPRGRIVSADVQASSATTFLVPDAGSSTTHFHLTATCNANALLDLKQRLNSRAPLTGERLPAWQLTTSDFLVKALALALLHVSAGNVVFSNGAVVPPQHVDIAVAILGPADAHSALHRSAQGKSLSAIASERTAAGKFKTGTIADGSAAVCDFGDLGVELVSGFINMPQAVVLAAGAPVESFVAVAGQPVLATRIGITLICDHRAIEVAAGARILAAIKAFIEEPALLLL